MLRVGRTLDLWGLRLRQLRAQRRNHQSLTQSDEGGEIRADPAQWMYSATKQESASNANDFLELRHRYVSRVSPTAWVENPEDLEWSSGQPQDISARRLATRQFACAHETVSTWRVTFRWHPRTLDCKGGLSRWDKCATEALSSRSAVLVVRSSMSSLAIELSS